MKKAIVSAVTAAGILLSGFGVYAATGTYSGKVPVINDLESSSVKKSTGSITATNNVDYIQRGTLVSWVELDLNGMNMTPQVSYSAKGTKNMQFYANGVTSRDGMHLNISTSASTLESVDTNGSWTPN